VTDTVTVGELLEALDPMLREMLTPEELDGAEFWASTHGADQYEALRPLPLDRVVDRETVVRWRICTEDGSTGGIWIDHGLPVAVLAVQSDLQDFIAESDFAWGQLRGPMHLF
jgi:hypothetical protein